MEEERRDEDFLSEEISLDGDEDLSSLFEGFGEEEESSLEDLLELEGDAEQRRPGPRFGSLAESPPPPPGGPEHVFRAGADDSADRSDFFDSDEESETSEPIQKAPKKKRKGLKGFFSELKEEAEAELVAEGKLKPREEAEPVDVEEVDEVPERDLEGLSLRERLRVARGKPAEEEARQEPEEEPPSAPFEPFVEAEPKQPRGDGDAVIPSQGGGGSPPDFEPPVLIGFDDDDDEDEEEGLFGKLRDKIREARELSEEEPAEAGLDLSAPGLIERIRGKVAEVVPAVKPAESEFGKLTAPLSGPQIAVLQQEVRSEEPLFIKLDRERRHSGLFQRLGFLTGLVALVFFLLSVGPEQYLTEVLPNAAQPDWLPEQLKGEVAAAALFAIGIVLPVLTLWAFTDAIRYSLGAVFRLSIEQLLLASVSWFGAVGTLLALASGNVTGALTLLFVWWVVKRIVEIIDRRWRR